MDYSQIAWFPLCAGLTGVGLVLSFLAFRRRGAAAGMRMAAWALLPLAAYLTKALQTLWNIGAAVVTFVTSLVFNPTVWAGVAVAGLSAVLFVVSGFLRGRRLAVFRKKSTDDTPGKQPVKPVANKPVASQVKPKPAVAPQKAKNGDDDFSDIEDLLKRRGIS